MKKDRYILTPEQYAWINGWLIEELAGRSSGWSFFLVEFFQGKRDQVQTRIRRELISLTYSEWGYRVLEGKKIELRRGKGERYSRGWKPLPLTLIAQMFGVRHSAVIAALRKSKRESRNQ